jgi:hypothetical protein
VTLVLTVVSNGCVVQASDRLVTVNGKEHDPLANKTVIYIARDALSVIGYSGLAYLDSIPTDQRIAEILHGESFGEAHGTKLGEAPLNLRIGLAAIEIGKTFERGYALLGKNAPLGYAVVAGFQLERKARGTRPFGWQLTNTEGGRGSFEIRRYPRHVARSSFVLFSNPDAMTAVEKQELLDRLLSPQSVTDIEDALVETIRVVAARVPTAVGADAMTVALPSGNEPVRARYVPAATDRAAYSPFVVAPACVHMPSILVGTVSLHVGAFEIILEAPAPNGAPLSLSSQPRQPPPRSQR